ncbi:hypothetical protein [Nocardioides sp.]|uniref:hypothetical protein n=1 Tax=Nocardioides sp. TaxID=35761 RepID=UPI003568F47F
MTSTTQYIRARLLSGAIDPLRQALGQWPVKSQQRARRNAMRACTALAQTRAEREEVEEFLARHEARRLGPDTDRAAQG